MDYELEGFDFVNVMLSLMLPQVEILPLTGKAAKAYMKMVSQWNPAFTWNLNNDVMLILTDF